jgi:phage terminase large subunit-like protein
VLIWLVDDVWQVLPYFWTPAEGLVDRSKRDRAPYDLWVKQGYIETTPGHSVDYEYVAYRIAEILSDCNILGLAFDRWRIDILQKEFDRIGLELPLIPYGQGYKDQSPALDALEAAFLNGRIAHGDHPVLTMCAANAVVLKDPAGNRKLDKSRSGGRIDGMAALANAMGAVCQGGEEIFRSRYDDGAAVITL